MSGRKISHSHPDFIEIIYKLAEVSNIDLKEYVVDFGCEDVDTFLRGLYKVRLKGYRDGQKIQKVVMLKWHPDPKARSCFREAYRREFVFYRRIIPKLLEIQRSFKNNEGLKIKFPNCILVNAEYDKETVAVLGLTEDGYKFRDRFHKMDMLHVSLVIKNMAKLHGLSYALAKTNPKEFEEISVMWLKDVQYSNPGPVSNRLKSFYDASVAVVSNIVSRQKLEEFGPNILNALYKCTQTDNYSTVCHADCWNNNIVFKYVRGRPVETIFIDYQLMRIASPITDISYFLYMSTDGKFLKEHYDQILDLYYATLAAVLRQCNLDVNDIFPKNIFKLHLKRFSVLGLIEALVSMLIITAENEEAIKLAEMKNDKCDEPICGTNQPDLSLFIERVNGVVNHFFERNYSLNTYT